jgi:hypothetical protein
LCRLRQTNADGFITGSLDLTNINQAVERKVIAGPFVEPARRHDPRIIAAKVALLRFGNGCLVRGMTTIRLFSEDLFHVAYFALHFTADFFCGAAVLQVFVPDRFAGFLFDFADSFFSPTFYFIVCA